MFTGHIGVGLAGKKFAPRVSLGILLLASVFIDVLWPLLVLAGVEYFRIDPGNTAVTPLDFQHYPISHGALSVVGWAVLFGGVYFLLRRNLRAAVVLGILVFSHWVLDFVSHAPDLPLLPWMDMKVGLGLWNSVAATAVVELGLFAAGIWIYTHITRPSGFIGRYMFWLLMVLYAGLQIVAYQGTPPPATEAVAWTALLFLPLLLWAHWADRHRRVVTSAMD